MSKRRDSSDEQGEPPGGPPSGPLSGPKLSARAAAEKAAREARLARAMRENLLKRKRQQRGQRDAVKSPPVKPV